LPATGRASVQARQQGQPQRPQEGVAQPQGRHPLAKALAGDNKAALTIIGIAQKEGILTPEQEQVVDDLSESDQAILEDVRRRLEASTLAEVPAAAVEVEASPEASDANEPVAP
jgi:hypothetical protein